jgi:hypothetical protein
VRPPTHLEIVDPSGSSFSEEVQRQRLKLVGGIFLQADRAPRRLSPDASAVASYLS